VSVKGPIEVPDNSPIRSTVIPSGAVNLKERVPTEALGPLALAVRPVTDKSEIRRPFAFRPSRVIVEEAIPSREGGPAVSRGTVAFGVADPVRVPPFWWCFFAVAAAGSAIKSIPNRATASTARVLLELRDFILCLLDFWIPAVIWRRLGAFLENRPLMIRARPS
jgi:hypothetical protein